MKGLGKNPRKRFETAQEMALALTRAGHLAPARAIAAWVATQCGAEISALRDKLERDAVTAPSESPTRAKTSRRFVKSGAALAGALILCLGLIVRAQRTSPSTNVDRIPSSSSLDATGSDALKTTAPAMIAPSSSPAPADDSPPAQPRRDPSRSRRGGSGFSLLRRPRSAPGSPFRRTSRSGENARRGRGV